MANAVANMGARTVQVSVSCKKPVDGKTGQILFTTENFPGLVTALSGGVEWRVTQARVEYSSLDPMAKGSVAMVVTPHDWDLSASIDAVVSSGGVEMSAYVQRRVSPSVGGFAPEFVAVSSAAAAVNIGTVGVTAQVGRLVVVATIIVRGFLGS